MTSVTFVTEKTEFSIVQTKRIHFYGNATHNILFKFEITPSKKNHLIGLYVFLMEN